MKYIFLLLLFACSSDVSIMRKDEKSQDTSEIIPEPAVEVSSEPSFEPSSEPSSEIEGIGGYVNYYLRQVACPACVGEPQELTVEFNAKFFEPTSDLHTDWIPEVGSCTNQLLVTVPSTNPIDGGQTLSVNGPNHSFIASSTSPGVYYSYLYETQYDRVSDHLVAVPNFDESFVFQSTEGFDYIEPYEMLYVDPSYAFAAPIYRTGMTFSWAPYGSSGDFMVTIAVYTQNGSQLLGYAACVGPDQGYLTFPGNVLSQYAPYSMVVIHLARHKVDLIPYQPLNSYIEAHMEWEVVGTGYLQ